MLKNEIYWICCLFAVYSSGCTSEPDTLFKARTAEDTGIYFNNVIQSYVNDTINPLDFEYLYNGGGVATGDFNNDGLLDLYFAGNFVSSKMFLNEGSLEFRDITDQSRTKTDRWATGVSVVDINNDGWMDIYVCVAGMTDHANLKNLLFINKGLDAEGLPVFAEEAEKYGIADEGYSTMAAFFDYNKDGFIDIYVLTNSLEEYNRNNLRPRRIKGESKNTDRLYRNNGNNTFTEVGKEAGILTEGWGLGVCIADLNNDLWPDIYVANDFLSNDLIWINQGDGTFTNKAADYLQHQSYNAMGVDIADYNNDKLLDIVVLDMLPETNYREKMMVSKGNHDSFERQGKLGYENQYMRNTLQLSRGLVPSNSMKFSEIGYLAGVYKTDWSWAPLFADFDNDGLKDLFISNGYRKDVTNLDFMSYNHDPTVFFGTESTKKAKLVKSIKDLPEVKIHNYMYRNKGDLTFEDVSTKWGLDIPTFSNGSLYADLDNDGDLDIVVNNIDDDALLYENKLYEKNGDKKANQFLRVKLEVNEQQAVLTNGVKVHITTGDQKQYLEYNPYRGYKSTVEPYLHFGLGSAPKVDTLQIIWPDGRIFKTFDVPSNQLLTINYSNSVAALDTISGVKQANLYTDEFTRADNDLMFKDITAQLSLSNFKHEEKDFIDYKSTPLLHRQLSKEGPYLAVGDLNNDGMEDMVIGGDEGVATKLFFQKQNGDFTTISLPFDSVYEDRDILIFDANNDTFNDIYIVSGGSQFPENDPNYQDRLYLNDGIGKFRNATNLLPQEFTSGSVVKGADYDKDGDIDLFIGSRLIPGKYPLPPGSYILKNDNGHFVDVTQYVLSDLSSIGMVTDANWSDLDNDGYLDLIVVGEWMPVTVFKNVDGESFINITKQLGLEHTKGWFHSLTVSDLNKDGFNDLILGNTGLNSFYKASIEEPIEIFAKDFDSNGSLDPILTHYNFGNRYISYYRDRVLEQIPFIKKKFPDYKSFAEATFDDSFNKEELKSAYHGVCNILSSFILENNGGISFKQHTLPVEMQISPITDLIINDFNGDGILDILSIGNSNSEESTRGRYDASLGNYLLGNGNFKFKAIAPGSSGFIAEGDTRRLESITMGRKQCFIFTRNDGFLSIFSLK